MEQRYPNWVDYAAHDLVLELDRQPVWVVLRRSQALEDARAVHWHLELRPLEADDMPAVGLLKDDRIARALAYIHEHFAESPSLSDIARIVHISPFHFHRLFTRMVGLSPKIYLQRKQLQVAKWLLRKGGMPIGQIARKSGFSSHGHFTSTFHRIVGTAPAITAICKSHMNRRKTATTSPHRSTRLWMCHPATILWILPDQAHE